MRYQTSRAMRAVAAQIQRNINDMTITYNLIVARNGWDDPRLDALDNDIEKYKAEKANLIARANGFGYAA